MFKNYKYIVIIYSHGKNYIYSAHNNKAMAQEIALKVNGEVWCNY